MLLKLMIKYCGQTSIICIIIMLSEFYILKSRINFPVTLGFVESIIVQLASWGGGGKGGGRGSLNGAWIFCLFLTSLFVSLFFFSRKQIKNKIHLTKEEGMFLKNHGKNMSLLLVLTILGDPGAVSRVDKMFVVKVYCMIVSNLQ